LFNFISEVNCKTLIIQVIMNKFQKEALKERLLKLATLKGTGAPAELAVRFEVSERSIKRIVREIRESGIDIRYSKIRESYVTDKEFQ